ncbi:hypothetical protein [Bacillus suaedaesalsae]|uniref:Uncharacterized protein n=1 Tax=Bacillus suaedaesalsae TaxID=2810349 RepID=A0ABS2DCZ5_9BACI|nr:hypothetical protein [Bacillus suaedaesalsae]MBM6616323.1 hypothetical protein [Bacillus suaedaesalsae]
MKIRSALLQTTKNLEPIFELEKIDNEVILQCLTDTFITIRGFSKNINKEATNYYEELLENIYYEDIPITDKMLREAKYIWKITRRKRSEIIYK